MTLIMTCSLQAATLIVLVASAVSSVFGSPLVENGLEARQDAQNIVYVTDSNSFWQVDPPHLTRCGPSDSRMKYDHAAIPAYQHRRQRIPVSPLLDRYQNQPTNPDSRSRSSGGMQTYCSPAGKYSSEQGELPSDFWRSVDFVTGNGPGGGRYAQRELPWLPLHCIPHPDD